MAPRVGSVSDRRGRDPSTRKSVYRGMNQERASSKTWRTTAVRKWIFAARDIYDVMPAGEGKRSEPWCSCCCIGSEPGTGKFGKFQVVKHPQNAQNTMHNTPPAVFDRMYTPTCWGMKLRTWTMSLALCSLRSNCRCTGRTLLMPSLCLRGHLVLSYIVEASPKHQTGL